MKLLILGGTQFLGRHIVDTAIARGHQPALFNRGTRPPPSSGLMQYVGDRNSDVASLRTHSFDTVIDCSGYTPEHMNRVADALGNGIAHYVFVSTISVYQQLSPNVVFNEDQPLAAGNDGYGALKARAEEAIHARYPERVAVVRPGLIVGPHDHTGRFTYWPRRFAASASDSQRRDVLVPGRPERPIQWIDVRDLAAFCVELAESQIRGTFNVVTPPRAHTMQHLVDACNALTGDSATLHWRSDEALLGEGIAPWTELPLWLPEQDGQIGGLMLADSARAVAAGLRLRSVEDSTAATLQWCAKYPDVDRATRVATLTAQRESDLLARLPRASRVV
jgi:2'-hydroxyisoflavone reductase